MGIGIDIVENKRVKASLSDYFIDFVLSKPEQELFYKKSNEIKRIEFLCGRFAAKEAIIKCLSGVELPFRNQLVILNDENGRPYINYKNYNIIISISHEKNYSVAVAQLVD